MHQKGILDDLPREARYYILTVSDKTVLQEAVKKFKTHIDGKEAVAGFSKSLLDELGAVYPDFTDFPEMDAQGIQVPSTPGDLWLWIRGEDRGDIIHKSRELLTILKPAFKIYSVTEAFKYSKGLDLTGYEDGTENPEGEEAMNTAIMADGSSFAAVQKWTHDFPAFDAMSEDEKDNCIGRRLSDNEEIDDAPESAHVKRTAQEDFEPEAFLVRRSMPWTDGLSEGLNFVAFTADLRSYEVQMTRMSGAEDGIRDALFRFTKPVSGNYFWCPPVSKDGLEI